jgi:iron complex outermembrane recepter protein
VHRIELEGAVREVDHSISGKMSTWTAGLRYEPLTILQLRGSYVKSIRAPSLTESYAPPSFSFETVDDPCDESMINSGPNPKARAANCAAAGIRQPFISTFPNLSGQQIVYSGNQNLQNELAASRALGFQLKPEDKMSLSVDYISIDLTQAIVQLNATQVLDACYDASTIANAYCARVTRNQDGQLQAIRPGFFNAGHLISNGVTAEFRYEFDVPFASVPGSWGTMDLGIDHYYQNHGTLFIGESDNFPISGAVANSRHQATINLGWSKNGLHLNWNTVFIGRAAFDDDTPTDYASTQRISAWWLNNFSASYELDRHLKLQLNVDNVFDKEPPNPLPVVPFDPEYGVGGFARYFSGIVGRYFIVSAAYRL